MIDSPERQWAVRATRRTVERLAEADARSGRPSSALMLVSAALELSRHGDFTVKQVVDRAGVALQTFYRHFGSKDELLLAVLEENILQGIDGILGWAEKYTDPLDRLGAVIRAPFLMAGHEEALPGLRFSARERIRLSDAFPVEVEECFSPYRNVLMAFIQQAAEAGQTFPLDTGRDADMVLHLVLTYTHAVAARAIPYSAEDTADYVWDFCRAALQRARP